MDNSSNAASARRTSGLIGAARIDLRAQCRELVLQRRDFAFELRDTFVDLGMSPLCESYVPADRANAEELFYPLHARVCASCLLVQLEEFVTAEHIFSEYAYFSSYSDSWVAHARDFVEKAVRRFELNSDSLVIELASNDGYLLQHVVDRGELGGVHGCVHGRHARERGPPGQVEPSVPPGPSARQARKSRTSAPTWSSSMRKPSWPKSERMRCTPSAPGSAAAIVSDWDGR